MSYIILKNSIQCRKCGDIIESKYVHDFVYCSCQSVACDGGKSYLRYIGNPEDYIDLSEVTSQDEDDWFEKVREEFSWGSFGKNGDELFHRILLKDMEKEHIIAVLGTQMHIRGTHIEEYFKKELEYRSINA